MAGSRRMRGGGGGGRGAWQEAEGGGRARSLTCPCSAAATRCCSAGAAMGSEYRGPPALAAPAGLLLLPSGRESAVPGVAAHPGEGTGAVCPVPGGPARLRVSGWGPRDVSSGRTLPGTL